MIDGLFRQRADALTAGLGRRLAGLGLGADAVTLAATGASLANSALFVWHRHLLAYAALLAATELLDSVDGAIARAAGSTSRAGSFLDAATDRYKETASLLAVALATGHWLPCSVALSGSLLVSYHQARAAMEGASARAAASDLFGRFERVAVLVAGLAAAALWPRAATFGRGLLELTLWALAAGTHLTALQRLWRGHRELRALDQRPR